MIRIFPWLKFFLAGLCLWPAVAMGADAIANAEHQRELDAVMQQANNLEAKNLNRFSLEALYRYAKLFDGAM